MTPFASGFEHLRHGVLREPVDLQVRVKLAQLIGDRDVALRMAEPDGRRYVKRWLASRRAAHPGRKRRRAPDEVAQHQVDLDWIAKMRAVTAALQGHQG